MPVFEPSVDTTNNQEQLTGILVPVLVMLGGIGISYGIYTTLRWFAISRRLKSTESDTEAVTSNVTDNRETTEKRDVRQPSQDSSPTLTSASPSLEPTNDARPPALMRIGDEAILARKAMKIKENLGATLVGKRVSLISVRAVASPRNAYVKSASTKEKENLNPFVPKRPSPLKNGYKPLVLGTTPVVAPRVPEPSVHPVHGYRYF